MTSSTRLYLTTGITLITIGLYSIISRRKEIIITNFKDSEKQIQGWCGLRLSNSGLALNMTIRIAKYSTKI